MPASKTSATCSATKYDNGTAQRGQRGGRRGHRNGKGAAPVSTLRSTLRAEGARVMKEVARVKREPENATSAESPGTRTPDSCSSRRLQSNGSPVALLHRQPENAASGHSTGTRTPDSCSTRELPSKGSPVVSCRPQVDSSTSEGSSGARTPESCGSSEVQANGQHEAKMVAYAAARALMEIGVIAPPPGLELPEVVPAPRPDMPLKKMVSSFLLQQPCMLSRASDEFATRVPDATPIELFRHLIKP